MFLQGQYRGILENVFFSIFVAWKRHKVLCLIKHASKSPEPAFVLHNEGEKVRMFRIDWKTKRCLDLNVVCPKKKVRDLKKKLWLNFKL